MPTGGKPRTKKPARKSAKKPAAKKPARKPAKKTVKRSSNLGDKTVPELRTIARRTKARQTNKDGTTKTKSELLRSIRAAKK